MITRNKLLALISAIALYFAPAISQNTPTQIQLEDHRTQTPISYAHYSYGNISGLSDSAGVLAIQIEPAKTLLISHIQYGYISISYEELVNEFANGIIPLKQSDIKLQPATVIGIHKSAGNNNQLEINYQDLLSHDAAAFLERSPEISSIKKSGAYGFDPVFRGFKDEQLNIIIDGGQNATAACPNRMDPPSSQVSLNMMDRVEILKGPYSLRYGNSFGGTIHFITEEPNFSNKRDLFGRVSGSYENNGNTKRGEAMLGTSGKKYNIKFLGAYSGGDDYTDGDGIAVPSEFNRLSLGGTADLKIASNQVLSLSATKNIAKDVDFASLPMDLRSDNTLLVNAKHQIELKNQTINTIKTMIYNSSVDHQMDNYNKEINPRMVDAVTDATTDNYGGRTEISLNLAKGFLFTGVDIRSTQQDGQRSRTFLMGPNMGNTVYDNVWQGAIMNKLGVFAEYHISIKKSKFITAVRYDGNKSQLNDPADEFIINYNKTDRNANLISFSLGVDQKLTKGSDIGLWLGRAQRSGSITELYINYFPVGLDGYEMLGNPDLAPEINNQVDLVYTFGNSKTGININLFAAYLEDYISSEIRDDLTPRMMSAPGVRQYKNIDEAFKTGFELSWKQKLPVKLVQNTGLVYTYAENLSNNSPLPETPPMEFYYQLKGLYFKNKLIPEIDFRYVWEQNKVSPEFGEQSTPEFFLTDIKLTYKPIGMLQIVGGINNLFDIAYYEHLSRATKVNNKRPLYAQGRNIFISASINF